MAFYSLGKKPLIDKLEEATFEDCKQSFFADDANSIEEDKRKKKAGGSF